jgi:hypothetical protein
VDEDGGVEDTVGVEVDVLDAVVLQEPLEEIGRLGISSGFFSKGYGSPATACHMSTSFS